MDIFNVKYFKLTRLITHALTLINLIFHNYILIFLPIIETHHQRRNASMMLSKGTCLDPLRKVDGLLMNLTRHCPSRPDILLVSLDVSMIKKIIIW